MDPIVCVAASIIRFDISSSLLMVIEFEKARIIYTFLKALQKQFACNRTINHFRFVSQQRFHFT